MNNKLKLIVISGFAKAGKDTFVEISKKILINNGYRPIRYAFADNVKHDMVDFLRKMYDIDAFTTDPKEKELIRPFFVAHGCGKRIQTEGRYWVEKVDKEMENLQFSYYNNQESPERVVALISDGRFENEINWAHEKWNGFVFHLKRYSLEGEIPRSIDPDDYSMSSDDYDLINVKQYDPPPNEEEAKNDPLIYKLADYKVEWENRGNLKPKDAVNNEYLNQVVLDSLNNSNYFSEKLHL